MSPITESRVVCVGSVLFTDLVGFTAYNHAVGDAAALRLLDYQTELADAVVHDIDDARIVKELGDGLMLWFASAEDGLAGAIDLLGKVDAARREKGFALAMRMGLHHGEVVPRGDDLVGNTINIAARVSDLAGPGELLVSQDVVRACGSSTTARLRPVGPVNVKGVDEPVWLHRVTLVS